MACIMKFFFYFIFFERGSLPHIYTFLGAVYFFCQIRKKIKKKQSLFLKMSDDKDEKEGMGH